MHLHSWAKLIFTLLGSIGSGSSPNQPVVPHKAVADVSKIDTFRRGELMHG